MVLSRILALTVLLATSAQAGVVISSEERPQSPGRELGARRQQLMVEADRLMTRDSGGGFIYRGDLGKAWIYDDRQKTYLELSPRIASTPPARRRAGARAQYVRTGERRSVGRWPCEVFSRLEGGEKTAELCIARLADLGLKLDDFDAQRRFLDLLDTAMGDEWWAAGKLDLQALATAIGFPGLPVHSVEYLPRQQSLETRVTAIERKPLPASAFELPQGYAKQEPPQPPKR